MSILKSRLPCERICPIHNTIIRRNARLVCTESGIARFLLSLPMELGRSSMAGLPQDDQECRLAGFWMLVITLDCLSSSCLSHSTPKPPPATITTMTLPTREYSCFQLFSSSCTRNQGMTAPHHANLGRSVGVSNYVDLLFYRGGGGGGGGHFDLGIMKTQYDHGDSLYTMSYEKHKT